MLAVAAKAAICVVLPRSSGGSPLFLLPQGQTRIYHEKFAQMFVFGLHSELSTWECRFHSKPFKADSGVGRFHS
jgi:hypothetical protein